MQNALEEIREICISKGLNATIETREKKSEGSMEELIDDLIIHIPEERDFKKIIIPSDFNLGLVKSSRFHFFKIIKGYDAIWSPELGIVECEIHRNRNDILFGFRPIERIFLEKGIEPIINDELKSFQFPSPVEGVNIFIGESSFEYDILFSRNIYRIGRKRATIRITGLNLKTHEEAKATLIKIANSVLFQMDLQTSVAYHISVDHQFHRRNKDSSFTNRKDPFLAPKSEFDKDALALYWYARTSSGMPLLKFLALYQVIEYYFPVYSELEAKERIKTQLKDPTFDAENDRYITKIFNSIRKSGSSNKRDERSQIKATIKHIMSVDDLIDYFSQSSERMDFFDVHKKSKGIAKQKINFNNANIDIRDEVALRIYEIRCRIVHTKDEDDVELLLPFSEEIKYIHPDIDLVEFIARKSIIAASRPLII
jgi:hypothetical protein